MTQEVKNRIIDLVRDTRYLNDNIDIHYTLADDVDTIEELQDKIQDLIYETDVIYYATAMKFLTEEDTSLTESLGLANDLGFSLDKLNSETLATILLQDRMIEELNELIQQVQDEELFEI